MAQYEIIEPKVDLRKKVRVLPSSQAGFDPVARAEQAMQKLSVNFNLWMSEEVNDLQSAWKVIQKDGLNSETLDGLFRASHDIKGQAQTMGFPIAGNIASSLCDLIENVTDISFLPKELLQKHVQSIAAVVKEDAREEDNAIGKALTEQLLAVSGEVIARFQKETGVSSNE
jgi:chemotaxis protein histidine kinase CheA